MTFIYKDVSSKNPAEHKIVAEIDAKSLLAADDMLLTQTGIDVKKNKCITASIKQHGNKEAG